MTIFVEIGKQFLWHELTSARADSLKADASYRNYALGLFNLQRDSELSNQKRACLDELRDAILTFSTEQDDKKALEEFKELLTVFRSKNDKLAEAKHSGEGITGQALLNAIALIQAIYDKLNDLKFLDIRKDKHPFSLFQYYAAYYFAKKISIKKKLNLLQNIAEQPKLSNLRLRAQEREKLIIESINECKIDLGRLDTKHSDYTKAIIRQVKAHIDRLNLNNEALCKKYGTLLNATTYVLSIANIAEQDDLLLSSLMNAALTDILGDSPTSEGKPSPEEEWELTQTSDADDNEKSEQADEPKSCATFQN